MVAISDPDIRINIEDAMFYPKSANLLDSFIVANTKDKAR
jgi:hypothetical protein